MGNDKKITIKVLIENDRIFTEEYNVNQHLKVIVNKTIEHFSLDANEERILRREDGTELTDLNSTIQDIGIRDGETLRYIKKAPRPPRQEGFAK
jgi:hypothetical protein